MTGRAVTAPDVPDPVPGLFSNAVLRDGILYVSGMHAGGAGPVPADMLEQARTALRRVVALVEAAGGTAGDVVRITVYVTDMSQKAAVAQARREVFAQAPLPAATMVAVTAFVAPDLLVEVDAVAHVAP
ncbi:RidA family protein [Jannaschia sp. 2305UL9-9]|uniref:RidA family protein n=1 Tax=Jannaschia sp. 2305UL9-9 TaxID=3121638 RepID=UPI003526FBF7